MKPLSTCMVVQSLDVKRDPCRPKEDDEEILEPKVPYLSAIGASLYLGQCTRPDISFTVNLLARYSNAPTHRHWTGIKDILRYLKGYSSDSYEAHSQMGYVFTVGGIAVSWRLTKHSLVAISSNHAEILTLHEATWNCFWLIAVVGHIRSSCDLYPVIDVPTTIYEDNATCIEELKISYIKGNSTKHITPKFFFSH
ncbi:secreted RxLR effector protein 161-like [Pyrus communis]|uniref:secreted RxLR effector protein 161-like n=1 Tax=Pyrus communis TaxID=23211 RepID=UPI0035C23EAD